MSELGSSYSRNLLLRSNVSDDESDWSRLLDRGSYDHTAEENLRVPKDYDDAILEVYRLRAILHRRAELGERFDTPDILDKINEDSPDASDNVNTRALWLVGLLFFQSLSSIILQHFETMLRHHPTIVFFLTMLIGAGGNAGAQSTVIAIRGFALGTLRHSTVIPFIRSQIWAGLKLAVILASASLIRIILTGSDWLEVIAISLSMAAIVFTSICVGTVIPIVLKLLRLDPGNAAPLIQVTMDIIGVLVVCAVSSATFGFLSEKSLQKHIYNELLRTGGEDAANAYLKGLDGGF